MSDWEYENGYVDYEGNILISDEVDHEYDGLVIELTPPKYLSPSERDYRFDIETDPDYRTELFIKHDRYNKHDKNALAVYAYHGGTKIFIGYVRKNPSEKKYSSKDVIEKYCFTEEMLKNISIKNIDSDYLIKSRSNDRREDSLDDYEKAEIILFKDNKVAQQASEVKTIEFALQNKGKYSFTHHEIELLEDRLTSAKLDEIGKTGVKLASDTKDAAENIIGGVIDIGIGVFNLFKSKK